MEKGKIITEESEIRAILEDAKLLTDNNIDVVMDRCIKVDHERLLG